MQLHVASVGVGPTRIALVHGFLGAGSEWHDLIAAAGDRVDVLRDCAEHPVLAAPPAVPSTIGDLL